ncbi:MAG: DUF2076 domain-containing protein [Verrucomicrobia bacterium]|nr:DUF2076 domain-containing protein [Verrucomicrobiota bacterium]
MTPEEQNLISSLFDRLRKADTATKDQEAEQLIRQKVAEFPAAPYLLVQSVLVLEHAVANAQTRIAELERQLAEANQNQKTSHGGFLSGLFGGGRQQSSQPSQPSQQASPPPLPQAQPAPGTGRPGYAPQPQVQPQYAAPPPAPYPSTTNMQPGTGGSFLKGALSTAAGVAGGALLFQGIQNLLGHHAGPFSSVLESGPGGFIPSGGGPSEVVNNYYMNENPQDVQNIQDTDPGDQGGLTNQNVEDSDPDQYIQNADYDPGQDPGQDDNFGASDDSFDSGGGGGDDSSYV